MNRQRGSTLFELVTVMAVVAIFAAIAVPSAAHVGSVVSSAEGARRLALVLRAAQAEAQSRSASVRVEVDANGCYLVTIGQESLMSGRLGAHVDEHVSERRHRVQWPGVGVPAGVVEPSRRPLQRGGCDDVAHGHRPVVGMRAMRLNVQSRLARGGSAGFTLLEVVVAGGILLLTIAAVTFCVVNVSRAGARLERSMDADRAVRQVAQRLRLLPYCASSYPQAANESDTHAGDLIAAVFPHADSCAEHPGGPLHCGRRWGGGAGRLLCDAAE